VPSTEVALASLQSGGARDRAAAERNAKRAEGKMRTPTEMVQGGWK